MSKVCLINPNLIVQKNDPLTTGIVYMPITLAYAAASLRNAGYEVQIIDAYAQNPFQVRKQDKFLFYGLTEEEILSQIASDVSTIFVYAINLTNHNSCVRIVRHLKDKLSKVPLVVIENTQAVTAYALKEIAQEFYQVGADYILTGEADLRCVEIVKCVNEKKGDCSGVDGVGTKNYYNPSKSFIENLDQLPLPAWDLFPLENYWKLRFAHGPLTLKRYLPLLTSRGCPYPCRFCVVPATNNQRWRARSAKNVVDEIEFYIKTFNVYEFHIEDLDPTISDDRVREICQEIIQRNLKINWKIASGTKVETIRSEETLDLMAQAGCRYISISPETGSAELLKKINKPFNLEHAVRLVKHMNVVGIKSQACFVLGFPDETSEDLKKTWNLVKDLTRKGIDEIALFIITPVPGSAIYKELQGFKSLSELNFTPTWRKDYKMLSRFRLKLYFMFLLWKLLYHPIKIIRQIVNFGTRRFETKMEMVPYRALVLSWMGRKAAAI